MNFRPHGDHAPTHLTPCTSNRSLEKEKAAKQPCSPSHGHYARLQHASSRSKLVPRSTVEKMYAPNIAQQIRLDLLERSFQGGMPAAVDQNLDPRDSRLRAAVQARVRVRCHDTVYSTTCGRIKKKSRGRPPILASLLPSLLRLEEKEGEKQAERRPGEHFFLFDHMWSNKRCHDTTRPLTPCTSQPSLEKEKAAKQTCSLSQWHCTRPQHASSRSILVPRAARRNDMRRTSLSKNPPGPPRALVPGWGGSPGRTEPRSTRSAPARSGTGAC
jgi:hypothetical protein